MNIIIIQQHIYINCMLSNTSLFRLEPVPDCELPKDSGSCFKTDQIRYRFNEDTERCEKFYFSGCQGNKNNFKTEPECRSTCRALRKCNTF